MKALIYGAEITLTKNINLIKYYESQNQIEVIGITASKLLYEYLYGYRCIKIEEAFVNDYDVIILCATKSLQEIIYELKERGVDENIIIPATVLSQYNFSFEKYLELKKSSPSIISINCWGGTISHNLGLEQKSPFVNMLMEENDYLRLLNNLEYYLNLEPQFLESDIEPKNKNVYPKCMLGDIMLYCLHYSDYEEVLDKWRRRVQRVEFDNLFVMMYTADKEIEKRFMELDYSRKCVFVPFEDENSCSHFIMPHDEKDTFGNIVLGAVNGKYPHYDLIELLLNDRVCTYAL